MIVVLQRLSYAVTARDGVAASEDTSTPDPRGLLPVSIDFALSLIAVPVLALIWGVSWAELIEIWTRFLSGFTLGETRISPSNFLTFILVFMVGALLTRFIKTTLKTTVMPRTRFDLGGQNAVVAGFGYVGIFLSALIAFGVAYGTDTAQVTQILQEVAEAHPYVLLNSPPSVLLTGFGADSIDFEIRAIIRDVNFVLVAKSEMFHGIVTRFDTAGIEIPFAQRDLWLRNPEALHPKKEN